MKNPVWAIGLMSGTSLDGIDAALVLTDGETVFERGAWEITPYSDELRHQLREVIYKRMSH
jgi:anhydro-N-acetylmuramic acid kinase